MKDRQYIKIIDFGGQFSHLIARRVRDFGVDAELVSPNNFTINDTLAGIILSGGPRSVGDSDSPVIPENMKKILDSRNIPVLGICYGHQLLGKYFGGQLGKSHNREYGNTKVKILKNSLLLDNNIKNLNTWMSHGDHISKLGKGFNIIASSENCPVVMMESDDGMIFGVQYHPEVTHTEYGFDLIQQFVEGVCKLESIGWSMDDYANKLIDEMSMEIKDSKVILGVSGGVDSLVAALVLHKSITDNLHLVFIDHGLLRKNETTDVISYFENDLHIKNFHFVDSQNLFLKNLKGISNPEEKRKIIGHTFIEVFEKKAISLRKQHGEFRYLAQGTIYSDRVESGSAGSGSAKIKSHHNLTLPDNMSLEIIEPLKELYKDEVRTLGKILGAPEKWINRFPFPGPGLAVRILGDVTNENIRILQEADNIFLSEIYKNRIDKLIWQAFAVLLSGRAVGVLGDSRAYGRIIALRAVQSKDGMTADFVNIPWDILGNISSKIINSIPEVTRVVYDISTKPPATIEFE